MDRDENDQFRVVFLGKTCCYSSIWAPIGLLGSKLTIVSFKLAEFLESCAPCEAIHLHYEDEGNYQTCCTQGNPVHQFC